MIEFSEKVRQICKNNYQENCGGCELRQLCINERFILTHENLETHIKKINQYVMAV